MTVNELIEELQEWVDSGWGDCPVIIPSPTGGGYSPSSVEDCGDEGEVHIY